MEYMSKAKILVADDIKQNVKLLRVILTASEFDVIEAYDGEEALEKAKSENPDLILLDIMMPKMTGYEVCQKLRANGTTKSIPIVMITALHEMEDRIKGIDAGADDFISKPFNKTELLARVKSLLRMRRIPAKEEETNILESILSGLEEGVVVTDGQWEVTHINQTAKELLDIHETDIATIDLQTHLSRLNLSIPVDTLMTTREKTTDFQILPSNTPPPISINARMTKLFDDHGTVVSISLILMKEGDR